MPRPGTPALLTRREIAGWRSSTRDATASTCSRSRTSHASHSPPISPASVSIRSARRARRTHFQPAPASSRAVASPIPDDAPVITATRSPAIAARGYPIRIAGWPGGSKASRRSCSASPTSARSPGRSPSGSRRRAGRWRSRTRASASRRTCATSPRRSLEPARHRVRRALRRRHRRASSPRSATSSAEVSTSSSTRSHSQRRRISKGRFVDTPRDRFWMALDISAYSLVACARAAEPLMEARGGGSIVTMTYLGGDRAVPLQRDGRRQGGARRERSATSREDLGFKNIRVNAISAGPVRTLDGALDRRLHDDAERCSRSARRSIARSSPRTARRRPRTSSRTMHATSPVRRSSSTPGITRWVCSPSAPRVLS